MPGSLRPERVNFAVARRCGVSCRGCYSFFGKADPSPEPFVRSARAFAAAGIDAATLSGGDPLTLPDLPVWLSGFRAAGLQRLKLDTVGLGLLEGTNRAAMTPATLLGAVDQLAIPLDGWSDASAALFRRGRPDLHQRTLELLAALDAAARRPQLIVNTVVHAGNAAQLHRIAELLAPLTQLVEWNLFQYTPTDQAQPGANEDFAIATPAYDQACAALFARLGAPALRGSGACINLRSIEGRLGHYLLVNSDGLAWLPDAQGRTLNLGSIFGRETEVLRLWAEAVQRIGSAA